MNRDRLADDFLCNEVFSIPGSAHSRKLSRLRTRDGTTLQQMKSKSVHAFISVFSVFSAVKRKSQIVRKFAPVPEPPPDARRQNSRNSVRIYFSSIPRVTQYMK